MYAIAIHGGAGTILPENMTEALEQEYHKTMQNALKAGNELLKNGHAALDAVEAAVVILENSTLFNAGQGAVFTHEMTHELEAAIMSGNEQNAGSVASLTNVKNPIRLARLVMEKSKHVMMIGQGAERFADENNLEKVENNWFSTDFRKEQLMAVRDKDELILDHANLKDLKFGTVGAVAIDENGNLAAATSTGGITNKKWGRVGDSSLIGCGTYAENGVVAISATGYGEAFIRKVVAHDVAARMKYGNKTLEQAADEVIHQEVPKVQGDGGLIAIDGNGKIYMPFNTTGMYRGFANAETLETFIYK